MQEHQVNPNDDLMAGRRPQQQQSVLQQGRPDDAKPPFDFATSTGHDVTASSVSSSANPSPRRFRFPAGVRERFLLQDSDNYYNMHSVSEHELTGDAESAAETNSPLMTSRGGRMLMTPTADRATSPSMASVTSGHSAASSAGGPGGVRRNLEWDSGADLVNKNCYEDVLCMVIVIQRVNENVISCMGIFAQGSNLLITITSIFMLVTRLKRVILLKHSLAKLSFLITLFSLFVRAMWEDCWHNATQRHH